MTYTAAKPARRESDDELRARIPGWGADADKSDRPSVPKEIFDPAATGAHWDFPERQPELVFRERSIEHQFLTPVFGTSSPLKGLSGAIKRLAYGRFSEARAAHWLLLLASDRVDVAESRISSLLEGRPDNLITETGITAEGKYHGISSRFGKNRVDIHHSWMDPFIVAGPVILTAVVVVRILRARAKRA
jgi:hypothetical protein